jgi:hypothetical protein
MDTLKKLTQFVKTELLVLKICGRVKYTLKYTKILNSFSEFVSASKDASYSYQCEILNCLVDFVCFLHCLNFFRGFSPPEL